MAQLLVRNVEEDVVKELKVRAAQNGRSAEAEHREILRRALMSEESEASFKQLLLEMPDLGEDSDFGRSPDPGREIRL